MSIPAIQPVVSLEGLTQVSHAADLHHDLLAYTAYISSRTVKRSNRDNRLPRNEIKELNKRLTQPIENDTRIGSIGWLTYIEFLARQMRLVSFEAQQGLQNFYWHEYGVPENYVVASEKVYRGFLDLPDVKQEAAIRRALVDLSLNEYCELYDPSPLGRLDHFAYWLRTRSTALQADFPAARRLLLDILGSLQSGVWYSTASLIQYLKDNHPYFLIPKKVLPVSRNEPDSRYVGFSESEHPNQWGIKTIDESDTEAFERVEGRFVERFLEGLPLIMRYVELAYHPGPHKGFFPMRGLLRAFKVNDRFLHLINQKTPPNKVTVQPNFEVVLVSEVYPAQTLERLSQLGDVMTSSLGQSGPSVFTLRLKKDKVARAAAANPKFDPVETLRQVTNNELAQNIITEMREWAASSEVFTLYQGFGLLESTEPVEGLEGLCEVGISPGLMIVRKADDVFHALEKMGRVPIPVTHTDSALTVLPDKAQTLFATTSRSLAAPPKVQPASIKREEYVMLKVSNKEAFEALKTALVELRVPVETDDRAATIRYPKEYDAMLERAVAAIASRFTVTIT